VANKARNKEPVLKFFVGIGDRHLKLTPHYMTDQVHGERVKER